MKRPIPFVAFILFLSGQLSAQTAIGLFGLAGGPSGKGPSAGSQVVTLYNDERTPSDPLITATYRLSNQQYTSIEGHPNTPGIVFGSTILAGSNAIAPDLLYPLVETYGSQSSDYTACYNCEAGTGIDIATCHAVQLQSFTDALIDPSGANLKPVNAKVWFADLTIDFNIPVTDPVFHFTGLGAWVYKSYAKDGKITHYDLGISAEFDLITKGVRLSRLSGSPSFDIVSGTTIKNTGAYLGDGNPIHGIARSSASGSVVAIGTNIRTVTFRISVKGDGGVVVDNAGTRISAANGNFVAWSLADNTSAPSAATIAGDGFLVGISLKGPEIEKITLQAFPVTETLKIFPVKTGDLIELSDTSGTLVLSKVAAANAETLSTQMLTAGIYTVKVYSPERRKKHSQKVVKW